jgi:multiple sugar transport system permease protein/raffinose/stachyose/melibiose transport system permease protein
VNQVLGDKRAILVLLGPALLMYSLIMVIPVVWSFGFALYRGNLIEGFTFVGLSNFARLFTDEQVGSAVRFTLLYTLVISTGQIVVGYSLALFYTFVLRRSSNFIRTLVFFPVVLPSVAVGLMFSRLFAVAPNTGPVESGLNLVGVAPFDFFASAGTAFWVIILMDLWRSMGFYGVLLYSGIIDIPVDILEAARIDGARGWRLIRSVVLPLSLPILVSAIIFSLNASLKVFDTIVALTNGGPGYQTTPITLLMFQTSFFYSSFGYGSSMAILISVMCLSVTAFIFKYSRGDLTVSEIL